MLRCLEQWGINIKKQQNHARKIAVTSYLASCGIGVAGLNRKENESTFFFNLQSSATKE
jgi:hypothetical protein